MNGTAALALYGGILALLAIGVLVRPAAALAGVCCIYGLKQWGQSTNGWLQAHPPATNIAVGILVLCAIVVSKLKGRCVFCQIPAVTWWILALLLYSIFSVMWTPRKDIAEPIWVASYPYLLTFILLGPLVLHEVDDFRAALGWFLVMGGVLVVALLFFGHWGLRGLSLGDNPLEEETNPLALAGLGGTVAGTAMLLRLRRSSFLLWMFRLVVVGAGLMLIIRSESPGQ